MTEAELMDQFDLHYLYMKITMLPDLPADVTNREFRFIWKQIQDIAMYEKARNDFPNISDISNVDNFNDVLGLHRHEILTIALVMTIELSHLTMENFLVEITRTYSYNDYRSQQYLGRVMNHFRLFKDNLMNYFARR